MRYQPFRAAAFFAATILLAASAKAQPTPRPQDCTGKPGADRNLQIKACTALIEAAQGSPQDRAKAYKSRASAYFAIGDDDRAMADDDAAIRIDPNMASAYNGRGDIYMDRDDPDRAIAAYSQALQRDPKYVAAYTDRSYAYDQAGDFDRALADANEAIRLNPKSAEAYTMRGNAYAYKGEIERALADYAEAIRVDPKGASDAYAFRGLAYMAKGDFAHAAAAFSESVRIDPQNMSAYFNRGRANLFAGALPQAIEDYKRAIAITPGYPYAALWLDIAEARSKLPSTLPQAIAKLNMTKWPAPVIRMYLGQMKPAAVLAAAADPNAAKQIGQVCEANFYSGEWVLRQGAKDEAARRFRVAARDCPKTFFEATAAALELKRLGATP
ncbi:MAG: tetratricopeptide repeat protein [Rhizomicrobium sp.]